MPDAPTNANPWDMRARRFSAAPFRYIALVLLLAAFFVPPSPDGKSLLGLPCLCGFRMLTGLPCPGCGLTRGIIAGAHGRWAECLAYQPAAPFVLALLCVRAVCDVRGIPIPDAWQTRIAASVILLLGFVWILRLCRVIN